MGELACGLDVETYERIHCVPLDTKEEVFGGMDISLARSSFGTVKRPSDEVEPGVQYEASGTITGQEDVLAVSGVGSQAAQREGEII